MQAWGDTRAIAWRLLAVLALTLGLLAPALAATGGAAADAQEAADDELDPSEDNADPASREACADQRSDAGSLVTRRLIDGPRQADGSLAFISGVCIYLPPGYASGALRYPVLYLLHGAWGWQHDWVVQGGMQAVMDELYAEDPDNAVIVVMPDGSYGANWRDDTSGFPRNETYVFEHVIPYVDRHFRTIADRAGRAMSGLSNGGAGTLRLASKRPDFFSVVTAMSAALPVNMAAPADVRDVANDPTEMADNLDNVDLALIWGLTCGTPEDCAQYGAAWGFEHACCNNEVYVARLRTNGRERPFTYEATDGGHDWRYWNAWLRDPHGPFILEHLADPVPVGAAVVPSAAPDVFRFRTIAQDFSIYGYDLSVQDRPAREFLTLTGVSTHGMTLRGSGTVEVSTAPRYDAGVLYAVSDARPGEMLLQTADGEGRLHFSVDLGEGHTAHQYSPEQLAAEASSAGGYWRTRTVTITRHGAAG